MWSRYHLADASSVCACLWYAGYLHAGRAPIRKEATMTARPSPLSPASAPRFFYGWVVLVACFLITTVASGTMMGFGVFINPMADDMGWSHSSLSLAYAVSSLVTGVGVLLVGSILHAHSV